MLGMHSPMGWKVDGADKFGVTSYRWGTRRAVIIGILSANERSIAAVRCASGAASPLSSHLHDIA
jgi:hypothetical protein